MKESQKLAECAALAKAFIVKRQGPVGDADSRDKWYEQLGLVVDAYVDLLAGGAGKIEIVEKRWKPRAKGCAWK